MTRASATTGTVLLGLGAGVGGAVPGLGRAGLGRAYRTAVTAGRWLVVAFWVAAAALVTILIPSSTGGGGFGSSRHHAPHHLALIPLTAAAGVGATLWWWRRMQGV